MRNQTIRNISYNVATFSGHLSIKGNVYQRDSDFISYQYNVHI